MIMAKQTHFYFECILNFSEQNLICVGMQNL